MNALQVLYAAAGTLLRPNETLIEDLTEPEAKEWLISIANGETTLDVKPRGYTDYFIVLRPAQ